MYNLPYFIPLTFKLFFAYAINYIIGEINFSNFISHFMIERIYVIPVNIFVLCIYMFFFSQTIVILQHLQCTNAYIITVKIRNNIISKF